MSSFREFLIELCKNGPECTDGLKMMKYPGSWRTTSWEQPWQSLARSDDNA